MAIVGSAEVIVHAITASFKQEVEDALNGLNPTVDRLGENLGNRLSNSFGRGTKNIFGNVAREADAARAAFNRMTKAGYLIGPAIAGAVSAVSDLIFALGGMVSAIGSAAPALAVLASGFASVIQGAITAKLAFGGIGGAVSAILKSKSAGGGGGGAKGGMSSAQKAAQRAYQNSVRRLAEIERKYGQDTTELNNKKLKALLALNQAYREGAESIKQLRFELEGANLTKERAAIELERARETLMRSMDLPVDSRARREAELAFKEAELNYRKSLDNNNKLQEQVDYANKNGVEGTEEVIKAKEDLAEIDKDMIELQQEHNRDVEKANEDIEYYKQRMKEAGKSAKQTAAATNGINDALKKLSPEARRFAYFIAGLEPVFLKLKAAAGRYLFGPLERAIQNLVDKLVPVLIPILEDTGRAIGKVAVAFSDMLTTPKNIKIFKKVFGEDNIKILENLGMAVVNVSDGFLTILEAVSPLAVEFSKFINDKTLEWSKNLAGNTEGLSKGFQKAADAAKIIGGALKGLWKGIKAFGEASAGMGLDLIKSLGKAGESMADFFSPKTKAGQEEMKAKFAQIGENAKSIGRFFGAVLKMLFNLAGNPGVAAFFDTIAVIPEIFTQSGQDLTGLGKTMGEFFVQLAKVVALFLETGGAEMFFKVLTNGLKFVEGLFSDENIRKIFLFLATFKGFALGIGTVGKVFKFFLQGLFLSPLLKVGNFIVNLVKAGGPIKMLMKSMGPLGAAIGGISAPAWGVIAAVAAIVAVFIAAYANSEKLRDAISNMVDVLKGAFKKAWKDIQGALEEVGFKVEDVQEVFKNLGDFISVTLVPWWTILFGGLIRFVGGVVAGIIRIVKGMMSFGESIKSLFSGLWSLIQGDWEGFAKNMKKAFNKFVEGLSFITAGIAAPFVAAWNGIADGWNGTVANLKIQIPDWVPDWLGGGKSFTLPRLPLIGPIKTSALKKPVADAVVRAIPITGARIPGMAEGGVVQPRPGGIQAILAEAGRPERVEPLDSDGLSVRDRAIIQQLASQYNSGGGRGHNTFNIYPSAGMDERALASMVARRVEWQRLRGQ